MWKAAIRSLINMRETVANSQTELYYVCSKLCRSIYAEIGKLGDGRLEKNNKKSDMSKGEAVGKIGLNRSVK